MPPSNDTFYNLKRLHVIFLVASAALLGVTVWMLVADHRRPWKDFQRTYRDHVEQADEPLAIRQIWLPDLPLDYNFSDVARFDRCATCHQGIDKTGPTAREIHRDLPQPYSTHPRADLFVGPSSPHPINEFGCTICHDGQGSATDFRWASHSPDDSAQQTAWREKYGWERNAHWDLPMLPKRFDQSRCLKCHHEVDELEPSDRFPDPPAPKLVAGHRLVRQLGCFGCHEINGFDEAGRRVGPDLRLESVAARDDTPSGTMRKVGPSLHETSKKLGMAMLLDWIRNPKRFLPSAKMPQFYGNYEHLEGPTLGDAKRFESVEAWAIGMVLWTAGPPTELLPAPESITETASVERGKQSFLLHGCLACHQHADFPDGQATQGPNLSGIGAKYHSRSGAAWLTDWLRDPHRHSPRTLMPNPLLEPERLLLESDDSDDSDDEEGDSAPRMADPAADMAAYLLASRGDYRPLGLPPFEQSDLDDLALMYLRDMSAEEVIRRYPTDGIPDAMVPELSGVEVRTFGPPTQQNKLYFVGRQTIRRRGCCACHDIPGFEDAPSIGPELADWGRKHESLLTFEQIRQFVAEDGIDEGIDDGAGQGGTPFFTEALREHRREGFLWQKLRQPRSFDFRVIENRPYNQGLTMPRFDLSPERREAIMTFVLGLVADPPMQKYVYHPSDHRRAVVEGRTLLEKYACAECHTLEMERWTFEFDPDEFYGPIPTEDYAFLAPHFSAEQIAASTRTNQEGLGTAQVIGMPRLDAAGAWLEDEDDDGNPLYFFTLWEPAVINGEVWNTGGAEVMISRPQLTGRRAAVGGAMARMLFPVALARARAAGSAAIGPEAWGWVPPPLLGEGEKVQPEWLRDYLLRPTSIRPAAVLRMPRYNMSPAEATKLADYFAAVTNGPFRKAAERTGLPGNRIDRMDKKYLARLNNARKNAWKILTDDTTFCAKCHLIGDFSPGGATGTTLAPDLEQVGGRIRPEFLRRWLAHPKVVLPYTGMPVNFPPSGDPLGQDLFPGSSTEQLEAVTELLLHYDAYLRSRTSIREQIETRSRPK